MFIIIIAIYVAFGLVTSVIGVIIDKFQIQYNVPLQVAALLPFAFYLSYGLFSVPFGVQMDRIGAKAVLISGMVLMTLGCLLLYLSNNYILVIAMIFPGRYRCHCNSDCRKPFYKGIGYCCTLYCKPDNNNRGRGTRICFQSIVGAFSPGKGTSLEPGLSDFQPDQFDASSFAVSCQNSKSKAS